MDKYTKLLEEMKKDEQFAKELLTMSPEDASKKLNDIGLDFSKEELLKIASDLEKMKEVADKEGEISEEDIEKVVGGGTYSAGTYGFMTGLYGFTIGCAIVILGW